MKKKIIIPIIILLLAIICVLVYLFVLRKDKYMTISLDINPSIELSIDKDNIVKEVKAINSDGKDIISNDFIEKNVNDVLLDITNKVFEKGYFNDDHVTLILYTDKEIDKEEIINHLHMGFNEHNLRTDVIIVEEITKEDKELAKKYNISEAKANYINSIKKEKQNIDIDTIIDKPVDELNEIQKTGKYCDKGYTLRGDFCEKDVETQAAKEGLVCPEGYVEYKGVCYLEGQFKETDNLICRGGFKLIDNECVNELTEDQEPIYHCDKGELMRKGDVNPVGAKDNDKMYCIDKSTGKAPTLRCLKNPGHIMINGKCYNGPAPTINGGCPNGDTLKGGWCYSLDDEDQWVCPSGNIYEKSKGTYVELCPDTFTYIKPEITGYKCNDGFELKDNKCYRKEIEDPVREKVCIDSKLNKEIDRCLTDTTSKKIEGYYCDIPDARVEKDKCIRVDRQPAKTI